VPDDQGDKSRMNREVHVRICGSREVQALPATRPPDVIMVAVRWCLRCGLSHRDVEELPRE